MADTLKRLIGPSQIAANTDTALTAVPAGKAWTILELTIVNTSANAVTFKLGIGGTSDAQLIDPAFSIDAGGKAEWSGKIMLAATEALHILASAANALTVTAHGLEQG